MYLDLVQGTPRWLAYRKLPGVYCASDIAAVCGVSPYKTKEQYLTERVNPAPPNITAWRDALFYRGHMAEKAARPYAESKIGADLAQAVFERTVPTPSGLIKLLASLDGITYDFKVVWENKLFNNCLCEAFAYNDIPLYISLQVQQQMFCAGAERAYITISDGTEDRTLGIWCDRDEKLIGKIISEWCNIHCLLEGLCGVNCEDNEMESDRNSA